MTLILAQAGGDVDLAILATRKSLDRISDQVMQDLAQSATVCLNRWDFPVQVQIQLDTKIPGAVKITHFQHNLVDIQPGNFQVRCPGVIPEGIHHVFHGFNLLDDDMRGPIQNLALFLTHAAQVFPSQSLSRELDGRQGILDFMGKATGHLAPCGVSLALQQGGNFIKHDHHATQVTGQRAAGKNKHPATRSFQAIRIAINDELITLSEALNQTIDALGKGGRLAVISFHSIEDRIVKQFIQKHSRPKQIPKGLPIMMNDTQPCLLKDLGKVKPSNEEIKINRRSRSAILRIAEKC